MMTMLAIAYAVGFVYFLYISWKDLGKDDKR